MCVFRLRNRLELDDIIEELSAVYDKNTLMEMYELATRDPYSFWYVHLAVKRREDMFFLRLEKRMIPASGKRQDHQEDGSLLQMLLKAVPSGPNPRDSDTEVEVLAPILCCSTVTVEEIDHI